MGMPNVSISFTETASTAVTRGDRGIIAMILKDKTYKNQTKEYITAADIPTNMLTANKQQIELALRGYENAPKKVVVYFIDPEAAADYSKALNYFEINKFNYLVAPSVETDKKTSEVVNFIKKLRENGKMVKAILPNTAADSEGIINYTTASVTEGDTVYTTEQFCSRIAGIIAGTPLSTQTQGFYPTSLRFFRRDIRRVFPTLTKLKKNHAGLDLRLAYFSLVFGDCFFQLTERSNDLNLTFSKNKRGV